MTSVYAIFSMMGETNGGPTFHLISLYNELSSAISFLNEIVIDDIDINNLAFPNNGTIYTIGKREAFDNVYVDLGDFGGYLIEKINVKD